MSILKYPLLNKKNEVKENTLSKNNLKSLDYELENDENINKFKKFNSHSIKNIFTQKKLSLNNNSEFPVKLKLDNKRNITSDNNLIISNNIYNKKLERKTSRKNIKNENIFNNKSINLIPFSPKRILTISTENNHFGYEVDENGNMKLLDEQDNIEKFNGTKNNSIGPDRYNIIPSPRKRLIIDWSKSLDDKKININDIQNIKMLSKLDNLFLTNVHNRNNQNKTNENKMGLSKSYSYKTKDWRKEDNYIKEKLLKYEKQKKEIESYLGPGTYNLSDEFIISPKKIRFQNFGSFKSRNLHSPKDPKKNPNEDNIKFYFLTDKIQTNSKENNDKIKLYKNSKFFTYKLKAEILKEKNIQDKNKLYEKMGPGCYEIKEQKYRKENNVGNFGFFEKRNLHSSVNKVWDCSYLPLEDWTKKFTKNGNKFKKKENIFNLLEDIKIKPEPKEEQNHKQNLDKEVKINIKYNLNRPGFNSDEPRFYIFQSAINEMNGVGRYNLIPKRKNKMQFMPFIYSSERHNAVKSDNNPELGPGTYNKFDTFFQWNKKSYNIKIKDRIDSFKKSKI